MTVAIAGTAYGRFQSSESPEIFVRLHVAGLEIQRQCSDGAGFRDQRWCTWLAHEKRVFFMRVQTESSPFHLFAIFDGDYLHGDVYSIPVAGFRVLFNQLGVPWLSVLLANFLGRNRGMFLHACGVAVGGKGILFAGFSGSGKSTIAHLWSTVPEATILNDEMLSLREVGGQYRLYGMPWAGNPDWVSAASAPLEAIFFIRHASSNDLKPMESASAAKALLVQPYLGLYDRVAVEGVMDLVDELSRNVPCYDMGFVPDASALDCVRKVLA